MSWGTLGEKGKVFQHFAPAAPKSFYLICSVALADASFMVVGGQIGGIGHSAETYIFTPGPNVMKLFVSVNHGFC